MQWPILDVTFRVVGQSEVDVDPDPTLKKKLGPVPTAKT